MSGHSRMYSRKFGVRLHGKCRNNRGQAADLTDKNQILSVAALPPFPKDVRICVICVIRAIRG
jgi:hypothetical protein